MVLRELLRRDGIRVAAINDLTDTGTLAHLFKYDSVHGRFDGEVRHDERHLYIARRDGKEEVIRVYSEANPLQLPWKELEIDVVIESTGKFTDPQDAQKHLRAGAGRVLLSAPPKDKSVPTVVLGVNDEALSRDMPVISNASCTTNNVAMLIKVLDERWGVKSGYITTVHSYTGDQSLHDRPHRDLRRARAAATSMIPTTTGAAKAITSVFPKLEGKLGGAGIRVPVLNGSLTDFTCRLEKDASVEEINLAFREAAETELKGILEYTEDPIVSVDILGNPHSCIFDAQLTSIVGDMVKVVGWYDNESGYSARLADLVEKMK
ncbi:glyceraldehyde 3-phosphate dehydrogenase [Anseongella ginsenosidimutans]|uniref:Glyceraldehyde 3-phosphate dehydrogenase n=2 Tax=Anseongella ginsenosidimutans TaxID=496056 RepID=A0A4R3KSJ0_9SPHI|nr:glyceraldehyde 3-phosphate dehydrogenase [Anseongella ginsenosidimutans]